MRLQLWMRLRLWLRSCGGCSHDKKQKQNYKWRELNSAKRGCTCVSSVDLLAALSSESVQLAVRLRSWSCPAHSLHARCGWMSLWPGAGPPWRREASDPRRQRGLSQAVRLCRTHTACTRSSSTSASITVPSCLHLYLYLYLYLYSYYTCTDVLQSFHHGAFAYYTRTAGAAATAAAAAAAVAEGAAGNRRDHSYNTCTSYLYSYLYSTYIYIYSHMRTYCSQTHPHSYNACTLYFVHFTYTCASARPPRTATPHALILIRTLTYCIRHMHLPFSLASKPYPLRFVDVDT